MPAPSVYDEPMRRKQIHLPPHLIERARELGGGTLAAGVRRALEMAGSDDEIRESDDVTIESDEKPESDQEPNRTATPDA